MAFPGVPYRCGRLERTVVSDVHLVKTEVLGKRLILLPLLLSHKEALKGGGGTGQHRSCLRLYSKGEIASTGWQTGRTAAASPNFLQELSLPTQLLAEHSEPGPLSWAGAEEVLSWGHPGALSWRKEEEKTSRRSLFSQCTSSGGGEYQVSERLPGSLPGGHTASQGAQRRTRKSPCGE